MFVHMLVECVIVCGRVFLLVHTVGFEFGSLHTELFSFVLSYKSIYFLIHPIRLVFLADYYSRTLLMHLRGPLTRSLSDSDSINANVSEVQTALFAIVTAGKAIQSSVLRPADEVTVKQCNAC